MNTCRPGNAARILAKIRGQQTGRVIGGELMQVNGKDIGTPQIPCGSEFIRESVGRTMRLYRLD
jgi:hypothetical protein